MQENSAIDGKSPRAGRSLLDRPVGVTLFHLVWPTSIGIGATIAFDLVDTFYIGRLGVVQLAAIGFCFPVMFLLTALGLGLSVGVGSKLARAIGAGDAANMTALSTNGLLLAAILGAGVAIVGQFTIDPLFSALGAGPEHLPYIRDYIVIWYWASAIMVVSLVANSIIRANGNAMFAGMSMLAASVANAIVTPVFMFGLLGAPAMGIAGAAIGTLVTRSLVLIVSLWLIHTEYRLSDLSRPCLARFASSVRGILHIGLPAFLTQSINPLAVSVLVVLLAPYGNEAVAGFTVGARIEVFLLVPLLALQIGINPFVGQNAGAGREERLTEGYRLCLAFVVGWTIVSTLIAVTLGAMLSGLFTNEAGVTDIAARYLMFVIPGFIGGGCIIMAVGYLNPLGRPMSATAIALFRFAMLVILGWLLSREWQTDGIFAASLIAYLLAGAVAAVILKLVLRQLTDRAVQRANA